MPGKPFEHGFAYDIFISYANGDDEGERWVDHFRARLQLRLAQLSGRTIRIWTDKRMAFGDSIDHVILEDGAKQSAIFLVMLSPNWIESAYCAKECAAFQGTGFPLYIGSKSRIFTAYRFPVEKMPAFAGSDVVTRKFFKVLPNKTVIPFTVPRKSDKSEFEKIFSELATQLCVTLKALEEKIQPPHSPAEADPLPQPSSEAYPPSPLFDEVLSLFGAMSASEGLLRFHYERVIGPRTREPALWAALTYGEMVRHLCDFTPQKGENVPRALLEFFLRLTRDPKLKANAKAIASWIKSPANIPPMARRSEEEKLKLEEKRPVLVVELEEDRSQRFGEIAAFEARLFTNEFRRMLQMWPRVDEIPSWQSFEKALRRVISDAQAFAGEEDPLAIEFLVNPPLLDRAPHLIQGDGGVSLGEWYALTLRWRDRILHGPPAIRKAWKQGISQLSGPPAELPVWPLEGPGPVSHSTGVAYLKVPLPVGSGPRDGAPKGGWAVLCNAIKQGASFVYWLHTSPDPDTWDDLAKTLQTWLSSCHSRDDFPERVREQRYHGRADAVHASLFWDDPVRVPAWKLREVDEA